MESKIPPDIKLIKIDDNTLGQFLYTSEGIAIAERIDPIEFLK